MFSVALVVGGAAGVADECEQALRLCHEAGRFGTVAFVCNDMIAEYPYPIVHAVTLHPPKMRGWLRERVARFGGLLPLRSWCHRANIVGFSDSTPDWGGSTGLFAVKIARELGHDRIILAGVPMTVEGSHFRRRQRWVAAHGFRPAWQRRADELAPFVRSLSGWTQEIFGAPDSAWLAS